MNGSDCGMFACKYADCITKDRPINFTQVRQAFRTAKAPEPKLPIAAFLFLASAIPLHASGCVS